MSNSTFPTLPGLAWGTSRKPKWSSRVQKSVSGKRQAISYMSFPLYEWTLSFNVLREYSTYDELATLQGFFNSMKGQYDTFYYGDPHDAVVAVGAGTAQQLGLGNGSNKLFQLVRAYGGYVEPIYTSWPNVIVLLVNGVAKTYGTDWTWANEYGLISLTVAPPSGHVVAAYGTFRHRVAFTTDSIEFLNTDGVDIWKSGKITFESVKP